MNLVQGIISELFSTTKLIQEDEERREITQEKY